MRKRNPKRRLRLMNDIKKRSLSLLKRWCDKLSEYEIKHADKRIDASYLCPACHVAHGRTGDLIYPYMTLYSATGEEKYLTLAERSVDFTENSLTRPDGGYNNDRGNRWFGTTAFSALAIGETLTEFGDSIPKALYEKWENIFLRLSDFCYRLFDSFNPVINYRAGAAAIFAMAYNFTKDKKYLDRANEWEIYCRRHVDSEGLLFGETFPNDKITEKGCRGIDMGYNLEESVPLLIMHAYLLNDSEKLDFYKQIFTKHLEFLIPDGAIDNSFGTRHNKWTYFGSRTSDGILSALAKLPREPIFNKATDRVLSLYEHCSEYDLLALPMANEADEPTCIHHTFCHAKALAALYNSHNESFEYSDETLLPREHGYGVKLFQGGSLALITKDGFTATVNAVDIQNYTGAENFGGSLTLLWHKKYGAVCAATMHSYIPSEPLNMQYLVHSVKERCMTPRFIKEGYSSDTDKSVTLSSTDSTVKISAEEFGVEYSVTDKGFLITVMGDGEYILPIITGPKRKISLEGSTFKSDNLTVTSTVHPTYDGELCFNQVSGFIYSELKFEIKNKTDILISVN